jgi:SAM-dependent methyltransferase
MTGYDFGYPWWLTTSHLVPLAMFAVLAAVAWRRRWPRVLTAALGVFALWALAGYVIVQAMLRVDAPLVLPTDRFLSSGVGRVLDAGAGSGRSTLMVLQARPNARVTALDLYRGNFGIADNTPERLLRNARVAGVDSRVEVHTGDMRQMPFADATFDAAVSAYAIDHLDEAGMDRAFAEVARVLKPGGEFLLIVINADGWLRIAFPLPPHHGYFTIVNGAARWDPVLRRAGLVAVEHGTVPASFYLVARKDR